MASSAFFFVGWVIYRIKITFAMMLRVFVIISMMMIIIIVIVVIIPIKDLLIPPLFFVFIMISQGGIESPVCQQEKRREKNDPFLYSGHTAPILAGFLAVTYAEKTIRSVPSPTFQLLIICSLMSFFVIEIASKPSPFRTCLTSSGEIAPAIQPV